jgi:phosphomannomutase
MSPKFGTSGLRGLVSDLTDKVVASYVRAFFEACPTGGTVHVGRDLRSSSPEIAQAVINAVRDAGLTAINHGALPTPALALASITAGHSAIMVTGSHIPADRNGLKFYVAHGEINKADEMAIVAALNFPETNSPQRGACIETSSALPAFIARYVEAFGTTSLRGLRIGVYEHSSVARDVMVDILTTLGADIVSLARSDVFIPVDTEAVDPQTREMLAIWAVKYRLDAIVSTDGDGDRPMIAGPDGVILPGDIIGPLTATVLHADTLVTPISSNSLINQMTQFSVCVRTRIGSPFVIAGIDAVRAAHPSAAVVGYEANGGFLLGFNAIGPVGPLAPLMTRDSILPMIAPLVAAQMQGITLTQLAAALPSCFTASGRVQNITTEKSGQLIATLTQDPTARVAFFTGVGREVATDLTDGLRVTFESGTTVHIRPSGNAPECRCYVEAITLEMAHTLVAIYLQKLAVQLA